MTSYLETAKRKSILLVTILLTIVFILINGLLYFLNESFVAEKIAEENQAFSTLTSHLINENDVSVAVEYMEHYSHTHEVEVALRDQQGDVLFTTKNDSMFDKSFLIQTTKGEYEVLIDNTGSVTLDWAATHFLYMNVSLGMIYIMAIIVFVWMNKDASKKIGSDIDLILDLINKDHQNDVPHHYQEFFEIYDHIRAYLEEIDLLKEQKNMNVKGLVHDIKTPLTLMRYYVDIQDESEDRKDALKALDSMNEIVQDLMSDEYHKSLRKIDIAATLKDIVNRYEGVFSSKDIALDLMMKTNETLTWNIRDFTRVMENILSNAFYYSNRNSTVKILVAKEDNLTVEVRNQGLKLDEHDLTKLFEKGYRKKETMKNNEGGEGMGLYSSKLLLASINAKIQLYTEDNWTVVKIVF